MSGRRRALRPRGDDRTVAQQMAARAHSFTASGFFVLRTPLLAWDEWGRWCAGLRADAADDEDLEGALEQATRSSSPASARWWRAPT